MVGYHYMYMDMDGNRDGTSDVSNSQVLAQFPVTPISMTMEMHMFSLMYALTDDLTVMVMSNYQRKNMDHVTRMGGFFSTSSDGLGDTTALANYVFYRTPGDKHLLSAKGGVSFPTGSIDEKDFLPTGFARLPYPMQLGSGTYDIKLGGTYQYFQDNWSLGLNTMGTIRTGENDNDYRLGNELELDTWFSYEWFEWLTTTVKLQGKSWGDIDGADPQLNPAVVPTADPDRRGGTRVDLLFDIELYAPRGTFKGNTIGLQIGAPIYENLEGPQLSTNWLGMVGWQWVF